jgi:Ca-activated chloride channel family protein
MLLSLLLIPLLALFYTRQQQRRRQLVSSFGRLGLMQEMATQRPGWRRHLPPALFLAGLAILLLGLARPEAVISLPRVEGTVILAFDVSGSMSAADLDPTRVEVAKAAARVFVENQPRTIQIGVVAFGDGGVVVQPPTDDRTAVLAAIDRLSPQGGTSLGQGIFSSLSAIAGEAIVIDEAALEEGTEMGQIGDFPSAVVILLSDGENTGPPDPLEIAQIAAEAGVRIFPVGIGSPEGEVVQIEGFNILTQLNEAPLQEIASVTNGIYYNAKDGESLQDIYQNIDLRLTVRGEKMEVTSLVAGSSILLFLCGGALSLAWFGRVP